MARCGAARADGGKCKNLVRQGPQWCYQHPGGRSNHRPSTPSARARSQRPGARRQPRRSASPIVRPTPPTATPAQRSIAKKERRLLSSAKWYAPELTDKWSLAVLDHLDGVTQGDLSISNCASIAAAAARMLRKGKPPRRRRPGARRFLLDLMGGPSAEDSIASAIADELPLDEQESTIATARALQALGIALCRRAGRPPQRCPCFIDPATDESADVLALIIRAAVGDWTGLVIPFAPIDAT